MKNQLKYIPIVPIPYNTYNAKVNEVIQYIISNYHNILDLLEAAALVDVTPQYLSYLFRKATGYSFVSYYNSFRLNLAAWMLENTKMESKEIAISCGFDSPSYFVKLFHRTTKKTPLQYRKEALERQQVINQSTV